MSVNSFTSGTDDPPKLKPPEKLFVGALCTGGLLNNPTELTGASVFPKLKPPPKAPPEFNPEKAPFDGRLLLI